MLNTKKYMNIFYKDDIIMNFDYKSKDKSSDEFLLRKEEFLEFRNFRMII